VVENAGIGYEILIPLSSYDALGEVGDKIFVYTHLHVREDAQQLYGFATEEERKLFQMLISISGIGPRMALGILSGVSVEDFCDAVSREEVGFLTSISGVGRKTAERLIVELKGRVAEISVAVPVGGPGSAGPDRMSEAVQALISLGFNRSAARKAVDKCISETGKDISIEEMIRGALRYI
jgi:Holliday junction DNA helicase RuvA